MDLQDINIIQWNAGRGLDMAGRTVLDKLAGERNALICLIQESGRDMVSNWRWQAFTSGRASILVDKSLRAVRIQKWCKTSADGSDGLDIVAVLVAASQTTAPLYILSYYRDQAFPPASAVSSIRKLLLTHRRTSMIAAGDLNIHCSLYGGKAAAPGRRDLVADLVTDLRAIGGDCCNSGDPTWTGRPSDTRQLRPSTIDYTMYARGSEHPIYLHGWRVGDQASSDHCSLHFRIHIPNRQSASSVNAASAEGFCHTARSTLTPERLATFSLIAESIAATPTTTAEVATTILGDIQRAGIQSGVLRMGLKRNVNRKYRAYGWDDGCSELLQTQRHARRAIHRSTLPGDKDHWGSEWRSAHRALKDRIESNRRRDWRDACERVRGDVTSAELWKNFRRLVGRGAARQSNSVIFDEQGAPVTDPAEIAQLLTDTWAMRSSHNHPVTSSFDQRFLEKAEELREEILRDAAGAGPGAGPDTDTAFTMVEMESAIRRLPHGKAPGWDGCPYECLKALGPLMKSRVLAAMNEIWQSGSTPDPWKLSIIIPLAKTECPSRAKDFRPISLMVSMAKLMESMVTERMRWLLDGPIAKLSAGDVGFRKNGNTTHQILRIANAAKEAWADGSDLALVSLDVDKAFDSLWPTGLIIKMHKLGIRGRMLTWTDKYMKDRIGRVYMDGSLANGRKWELGTGQGGIIGPLLFVIYFSDLPVSSTWSGKYADDVAIWARVPRYGGGSGTNDDTEIDKEKRILDLGKVWRWGEKWRMTFSHTKTQLLVFTPPRRSNIRETVVTIHTPNGTVQSSGKKTIKLLGVTLDKNLTYRDHIKSLEDKGWQRVRMLRKISGYRWGADRAALRSLYEGWIRPALEYGSAAYGAATCTQLSVLQKIENAALRIIIGATSAADIDAMHLDLSIPFLAERRLAHAASMASRLRRINPNSNRCAAEFQHWITQNGQIAAQKPAVRLATTRHVAYKLVGKQASMFQYLYGAYVTMGLEKADHGTEAGDPHREGAPGPPWYRSQLVYRQWPTLKAAGQRTDSEKQKAKAYCTERLKAANEGGEATGRKVIHAFTDGSADLRLGYGGAAVVFCLPDEAIETKGMGLGIICTNFMAEVVGILMALEVAIRWKQNEDSDGWVLRVWCDCQPAVRLVADGVVGPSGAYWAAAAQAKRQVEHLRSMGVDTEIDWIPAHCGVQHNDLADETARRAADRVRATATEHDFIKRPHAIIRGAIKRSSMAIRQRWHAVSDKARRPKLLFKDELPNDITQEMVEAKLNKRLQTAIGRLRIGNETNPQMRVRMGMRSTLVCPNCDQDDSTNHRLFTCRKYKHERALLEKTLRSLRQGYTVSMEIMIGLNGVMKSNKVDVLRAFANFLNETGLAEDFIETRTRAET